MSMNKALGLLESHISTYFDHFAIVLVGICIEVEMGL